MKKRVDALFEIWKENMLPLSFVISSVANIALYYLGLAFRENPGREYGFLLCSIVFAVCSGIALLYLLKKERFPVRTWVLVCSVMLFFGVCFIVGFIRNGFDSLLFLYFQRFVVFAVPSFFAGICAAKWGSVKHFIPSLEKLSFFVLPAAVMYFNQVLFDANPFNWGRDLGIINYMSFAYTLMPFLLAHMLGFAENAALEGFGNKKQFEHAQAARLALILIYWIAIYSSGTRGAVVCVVIFSGLLLLHKIVHRMKIKSAAIMVGVMLAVLLFNLTIYAPPGMKWLSRMDMFLAGLADGKIVTAVEDENVEDNLDSIVMNGLNPKDPTQDTAESADEETVPGTEGNDKNETDAPVQIRSRGTLFKIALKEFLKSPITGMGPGEYSEKYGKYPHNAILELLAETGLVGTLFVLALVMIALKRMLVNGWQDNNVQHFLLFIMAYVVYCNISGTVWDCSALLCALGFGLVYQPQKIDK